MTIKITMTKRANGLLLQTGPYWGLYHQHQCFRDSSRKTEGEDLEGTYVIVQIHFS